jgi:hypothetical protein
LFNVFCINNEEIAKGKKEKKKMNYLFSGRCALFVARIVGNENFNTEQTKEEKEKTGRAEN